MWTLKLAFAARVVGPQVRTWLPFTPEIEQSPASDWLAMAQVTPEPEPAGSGSLTVTPAALPVPVLVTVTTKPIGSPALTGAWSATLVAVMSGAKTVKHSCVVSVWLPGVYW